jgi:hypothetical protein
MVEVKIKPKLSLSAPLRRMWGADELYSFLSSTTDGGVDTDYT